MKLSRLILPITVAAGLLIGLAPHTASASGLAGEHGINCQEGVCTLSIDIDGDGIDADSSAGSLSYSIKEDMGVLPAGSGFSLSDDLLVSLPVGDFQLKDAALSVELNQDNQVERLQGTAQLPLRALALWGGETGDGSVVANVGLEPGKNLTSVVAALEPERSYLYFNVGSGFELEAEQVDEEGESRTFQLAVPHGKQATLVLDTVEPFVYLSGDFDVSYDGKLFLLGQLTEPTKIPLPLDMLPVGQSAALHIAAGTGKDIGKTYLELSGGYAVDQGFIGDWIGLDVTPLAVEGLVALSQQGVLLTGLARSEIQPETLFAGELETQAFIPFQDVVDSVYVQVDGSASIPLANLDTSKHARFDAGTITAITAPVGNTVASWISIIPEVEMPAVRPMYDSALTQITTGYNWAGRSAGDAYSALTSRSDNGS